MILSATYSNPDHTAALILTDDFGYMFIDESHYYWADLASIDVKPFSSLSNNV